MEGGAFITFTSMQDIKNIANELKDIGKYFSSISSEKKDDIQDFIKKRNTAWIKKEILALNAIARQAIINQNNLKMYKKNDSTNETKLLTYENNAKKLVVRGMTALSMARIVMDNIDTMHLIKDWNVAADRIALEMKNTEAYANSWSEKLDVRVLKMFKNAITAAKDDQEKYNDNNILRMTYDKYRNSIFDNKDADIIAKKLRDEGIALDRESGELNNGNAKMLWINEDEDSFNLSWSTAEAIHMGVNAVSQRASDLAAARWKPIIERLENMWDSAKKTEGVNN